jgi:hypothetical protein
MTTQAFLYRDETLKMSRSNLPDISVLRAQLSKNRAARITFTKADGTERVMYATLNSLYLERFGAYNGKKAPKEVDESNPFAEQDRKEREERLRQTNLTVWDIEKNAWRSVRYETIQSFDFIGD